MRCPGALAIAGGAIVVSAKAWAIRGMHGWVPRAFLLSAVLGGAGSIGHGRSARDYCSPSGGEPTSTVRVTRARGPIEPFSTAVTVYVPAGKLSK